VNVVKRSGILQDVLIVKNGTMMDVSVISVADVVDVAVDMVNQLSVVVVVRNIVKIVPKYFLI